MTSVRMSMLQSLKICVLHLLLYNLAIVYCLIGAWIFNKLENPEGFNKNWSFASAVCFTFQTISTIGYGHLQITTTEGRLFCIVYAIIGIPFYLLVVLDIAFYIRAGILSANRRLYIAVANKFRAPSKKVCFQPSQKATYMLYIATLILVFTCCTLIGAAIFTAFEVHPNSESAWSFIDSLYFTVASVTTVGYGDLSPGNWDFLAVTIVYLTIGISIAVLFVQLIADYGRHLHYLGQPVKRSRQAEIWFGGKKMTAKELLIHAGRHWNVETEQIHDLLYSLDEFIEQTFDSHEQAGPHEGDANNSELFMIAEVPEDAEMQPMQNGRAS